MMLQPNGSDLITSKLIDTINSATKVCTYGTFMYTHTYTHWFINYILYGTDHGATYATTNGRVPGDIQKLLRNTCHS